MDEEGSIKKKTLHLSLEEVLWRKRLQEFLSERPLKGFTLTQRELSRMRRE